MPSNRGGARIEVPSPFVRYELTMGGYPPSGVRLPGWVQRMITCGTDNASHDELIERYGSSIRAECAAAGFRPHCDLDGARWTATEAAAAELWAAALVREHSY